MTYMTYMTFDDLSRHALVTLLWYLFTAAIRTRFENIRGAYRRYRIAMNKSLNLGKSGSGAQTSKPPKTYKYAAEAAFLDATFKMDTIIESMESAENSSNEVRFNAT